MAQTFATAALILIALAAALQIIFLLRKGETRDPVSHWALLAASLLLFAVTVDRSIRISFPAVTNTYESLVFFSAVVCAVIFVLRLVMKSSVMRFILLGGTIVALALLMISSSPLAPREIQPPIPALQSLWLVLHVTLAFIGEAFFVVSFVAAIVFLASKEEEKKGAADRIMYTSIGIGYPIFTAGALIFGAIWAEVAWGAVVELGPEGDVGPHHLAGVHRLPAHPAGQAAAGEGLRRARHRRLRVHRLHVLRGELPAFRAAQLRLRGPRGRGPATRPSSARGHTGGGESAPGTRWPHRLRRGSPGAPGRRRTSPATRSRCPRQWSTGRKP